MTLAVSFTGFVPDKDHNMDSGVVHINGVDIVIGELPTVDLEYSTVYLKVDKDFSGLLKDGYVVISGITQDNKIEKINNTLSKLGATQSLSLASTWCGNWEATEEDDPNAPVGRICCSASDGRICWVETCECGYCC